MGAVNYATKYRTARERVFDLLSDLRFHSWRELQAAGGNRYGARLLELRREGYEIVDTAYDEDGQQYRLVRLERGEPQPKRVRVYISESSAEHAVRGFVTEETREAVTLEERSVAGIMARFAKTIEEFNERTQQLVEAEAEVDRLTKFGDHEARIARARADRVESRYYAVELAACKLAASLGGQAISDSTAQAIIDLNAILNEGIR